MTNKLQAASLLVGERLIRLVIGFFIHAWMARTLSPEDFGYITYIIKGVAVYYTFGLFGTDEVIMKELISRKPEFQKDVLKTTLILRFGIGMIGWFLMSILNGFVSGFGTDTWFWMFIFGMTIPVQALTVYEVPFITSMSMSKVFYARNGSYFVGVIGKITALAVHLSKNIFVLIYALEEFCWKIFITILAFREGWGGGSYKKDIASAILKPSILAFLAAFLALFDQRLPFLFLEHFTDSTTVGQYSIMVSLLDIAILIPISLATALFPSVVHGKNQGHDLYIQQRQAMSTWLVRASLSFSIGASIMAPLIIHILYKGKYVEVVPVFRVIVFSLIFYFFNIGRFKWFVLEGALKEWITLLLLGVVIQVTSLALLIPRLGLMGVVVSVILAQVIPNILMMRSRVVRESLVVFFKSFKFSR